MSYKTKQCFKCKKTVYTFDNKLNKFGKPQEYDDFLGNEEHWRNCAVRQAEYQAKKALGVPQQAQVQYGQNREQSNTYVPSGYVQQPTSNNNTFATTGGSAESITNSELKQMITKMSETISDMHNTMELIAMALNVPLPGREPKRASGDISDAQEGEF